MSFCRGSGQCTFWTLCRPTGSCYAGLLWASLGPGFLLAISVLLTSPRLSAFHSSLENLFKNTCDSPLGTFSQAIEEIVFRKTPRSEHCQEKRWQVRTGGDKWAASSLPGRTAEDAPVSQRFSRRCPLAGSLLVPAPLPELLSSLPM